LQTTTGASVAFDQDQGKVVLLDFWATWCKPCLQKLPTLNKLHQDYGPQGLHVLGLNIEGLDPERIRRFVEQRRLLFPVLLDDGRVASAYGVRRIPHLVLVDRQGQIALVQGATGSVSVLRDEIEKALRATPTQQMTTPAP
jgi:thiol-disulfide isomerase/thioredoxin